MYKVIILLIIISVITDLLHTCNILPSIGLQLPYPAVDIKGNNVTIF